jgi:hypothetical protein
MTPESCDSPFLASGLVTHVSMTTSQNNPFSEQHFGKHIHVATNKQRKSE